MNSQNTTQMMCVLLRVYIWKQMMSSPAPFDSIHFDYPNCCLVPLLCDYYFLFCH